VSVRIDVRDAVSPGISAGHGSDASASVDVPTE